MQQDTKDAIYDRKASEHSKNAIFFWIIVGIGWIIFDKNLNLFSLVGGLLLIPGIFVASFASMPLFLLRNKISLNVIEKRQEFLASLIPVLNILDLVEMVVVPIVYLIMLSSFFKQGF